MKIYLTHATSYDYASELYAPLQQSSLNEYDIYYPHDETNKGKKSKDIIATSDLVLAEVSYPSTGQGIELGWADSSDVPIICFYKEGSVVSSSLRVVSTDFIEYDSTQDMLEKLAGKLNNNL